MKKMLLLLFITLIFIPAFNISAITIDDLSNSTRYERINEDMTNNLYIDNNSIQVIRYAPPYYIIQGDYISHDFKTNTICVQTVKLFYDWENKIAKMQFLHGTVYELDGSLLFNLPDKYDLITLNKNRVGGWIADCFFFYCYRMYFYDV
ncbi:hypothetical protein QVN49_10695 [Megasphaera hexanoica]|nr:hypothetical protein [Megasphaera hexanoica]